MSRAIKTSKKVSGNLPPARSKEHGSAQGNTRFARHGESSEAQSQRDTSRIAPAAKRQTLFDLAIWLGLILSTLAVYSQVGGFDFINYDDPVYVYQNAH